MKNNNQYVLIKVERGVAMMCATAGKAQGFTARDAKGQSFAKKNFWASADWKGTGMDAKGQRREDA